MNNFESVLSKRFAQNLGGGENATKFDNADQLSSTRKKMGEHHLAREAAKQEMHQLPHRQLAQNNNANNENQQQGQYQQHQQPQQQQQSHWSSSSSSSSSLPNFSLPSSLAAPIDSIKSGLSGGLEQAKKQAGKGLSVASPYLQHYGMRMRDLAIDCSEYFLDCLPGAPVSSSSKTALAKRPMSAALRRTAEVKFSELTVFGMFTRVVLMFIGLCCTVGIVFYDFVVSSVVPFLKSDKGKSLIATSKAIFMGAMILMWRAVRKLANYINDNSLKIDFNKWNNKVKNTLGINLDKKISSTSSSSNVNMNANKQSQQQRPQQQPQQNEQQEQQEQQSQLPKQQQRKNEKQQQKQDEQEEDQQFHDKENLQQQQQQQQQQRKLSEKNIENNKNIPRTQKTNKL